MGGFELGTAAVSGGDYAVTGGLNIVTSPVHSGNYAGQMGSLNTHLVSAGFGTGPSVFDVSQISCRMYIYFKGSPPSPSTSGTFQLEDVGTVTIGYRALLADIGGGNFRMQISGTFGGFSTTTGSIPISGNTWYRMDFIYDAGTNGVGKVYINGVLDINTTHTGTNNSFDRMTIIGNTAAGAEHVFDDIFCTDTLTVGPDGNVIVRQGTSGTPTDNAWTLNSCTTIDDCWSETPA